MVREIDVASLMKKHFEVEFVFDHRGRILSANHWTHADTAKFLLGVTETKLLWAFGAELSVDVCDELKTLAELEAKDPLNRAIFLDEYVSALNEIEPIKEIYDSLAYSWSRPRNDSIVRDCVRIDSENQGLLSEHFRHMLGFKGNVIRLDQPIIAKIVEGVAVSVCSSARSNLEVHECYVLTTPKHRNKGFAVDALRAWAATVNAAGAIPFYNTKSENLAAQSVATRASFTLYGRALRIH